MDAREYRRHLSRANELPLLYVVMAFQFACMLLLAFRDGAPDAFSLRMSVFLPAGTYFGLKLLSRLWPIDRAVYIQVAFFKSREEGDFTPEELSQLEQIYVYIANDYKNFKKYEQAKIISNIQSEIILSGEKAYLVTDDFMHIMSCNHAAKVCLDDILGGAADGLDGSRPCSWLPFLLGSELGHAENRVQTRVIRDYIFKIYTYDQRYSNGIVDRYHWITIARAEQPATAGKNSEALPAGTGQPLTKAELRVARLLAKGLTYQAVADKLVVSYHTVKKHVQNIYLKCGVNSRFQLYRWMEQNDPKK